MSSRLVNTSILQKTGPETRFQSFRLNSGSSVAVNVTPQFVDAYDVF